VIGTAIVWREPVCPECEGGLEATIVMEPALVRIGGYGATRKTTLQGCRACGWTRTIEVTEVRPLKVAVA
jgi:hypothetical protein